VSELVKSAEAYARLMHRAQLYGDQPYADAHLAKVAAITAELGGTDEQVAVAWLHDVVEDCGVSLRTIERKFGVFVFNSVAACTGNGSNRDARNTSIYRSMEFNPRSALVKVADRIANLEACAPGSKYLAMYESERDEFYQHVARQTPTIARKRLDAAYVKAAA